MRSSFGPKSLAAFLENKLLRQLGAHLDESARLQAEWLANVEGPLGAHVHPVGYESGQLRLVAETPAWASRARMQQTNLLHQLRKRPFFRGLRSVRIRVQPPGASIPAMPGPIPRQPATVEKASRLNPRVAALVRDIAVGIEDSALREALERLAGPAVRAPTTKTK